LLALLQKRQQHNLAVGEFQRVVVGARGVFVDLPEDRSFVFDLGKWPATRFLA
jgi:hypothetical protein